MKADSYGPACYWTNCQSHYCSDSLLSSSHHFMFLVYLLFTNDYFERKDRIGLFNMDKKENKNTAKTVVIVEKFVYKSCGRVIGEVFM